MAALNTATDKVVLAKSANPKDDVPVDARVLMARLFGDMGLMQITAANVAPSNKDVLWWHIDAKTMKRWDAVLGNWFPASPNQLAMHLIRRAVLGSVTDTSVEAGDLFMFWDTSLGEVKVISRDDLSATFVRDALAALSGQRVFIDTTAGPQTASLPSNPANNDRRRFFDRKGTFSSAKAATIARNGKTIGLSASDLILDLQHIGVELTYNAAENDWQITEFFRSNVA